jgi:arylsulfatase A-like enzyme
MRACLRILAAGLLGIVPPAPAEAVRVDHVVVIVVDGLLADGPATAAARAVEQPETLPSFMTLATGLPPSNHGVTWNNDRGGEHAGETLFSRVHGAGRRTGLYYGKTKLTLLAPRNSADVLFGPGRDGALRERRRAAVIAARFAAAFPREGFGLALVHFVEPDSAGHDHGWMSAPYLAAVAQVDRAVGEVLRAIEASGRAGATAVLLTSDHGGEGTNHGVGRGETSWRIPFACRVPGVQPSAIASAVTLMDVAPTALALLGLENLPGAQGRPVPACLGRR